MPTRITFKDTQHSESMEQSANKLLEKIETFLDKEDRSPIYIDLILEPSHVHAHHHVELRVKSPNYNRYSSYEGKEFFPTLERVVDVMYRELLEDKKRLNENKRVTGRHDESKRER
jgi:ribosome-associated translation inhibitor RaiA